METQGPAPAGNDTTLAALAHLFGWMSATVVLALSQGRSPYVRFQALQALVVDLALTLVGFVLGTGVGLLMGLVWPATFIATMMFSAPTGRPGGVPATGPTPVIVFLPFALFAIVMPCMALWGLAPWALRLYALFRAATGHVYAYPLIGRWLKAPPDVTAP